MSHRVIGRLLAQELTNEELLHIGGGANGGGDNSDQGGTCTPDTLNSDGVPADCEIPD